MSRSTFTTTLTWEADGEEVETAVRVVYIFYKGYPDTWDEPGADCEVEIISLTASDPSIVIPERFETDADLLNECVADWCDRQEDAREWRAQARRDAALMDALERRNGGEA